MKKVLMLLGLCSLFTTAQAQEKNPCIFDTWLEKVDSQPYPYAAVEGFIPQQLESVLANFNSRLSRDLKRVECPVFVMGVKSCYQKLDSTFIVVRVEGSWLIVQSVIPGEVIAKDLSIIEGVAVGRESALSEVATSLRRLGYQSLGILASTDDQVLLDPWLLEKEGKSIRLLVGDIEVTLCLTFFDVKVEELGDNFKVHTPSFKSQEIHLKLKKKVCRKVLIQIGEGSYHLSDFLFPFSLAAPKGFIIIKRSSLVQQ